MSSRLRWAWVAGALLLAAAGCTPDAEPATASSPLVPAGQVLAAGCPDLSVPQLGVEATGKRLPGRTVPEEQPVLDRLVPGAQMDHVVCQYSRLNSTSPGIVIDVRAFRGQNGPAEATAVGEAEQVSTSGSYPDFVTVPAAGDNGGFAWYDAPEYCLAARSGNAYVVIAVNTGAGAAQGIDGRKALQKQVPTLTAIMADAVDALR